MLDEKDESSGFKVIDKRSFSEDGTPREETREKEHPAQQSSPPSGPTSAQNSSYPEELGEEVQSGFNTLVSYLSTTAMFQLGLLPGPGGERIPVDLVNARLTIDLLEVLQEKTQGNLTDDEAKLLEEVLFELRMSFVEVQKRAIPKPR